MTPPHDPGGQTRPHSTSTVRLHAYEPPTMDEMARGARIDRILAEGHLKPDEAAEFAAARPARLDTTTTPPRDVWADALTINLDVLEQNIGHEQCRGKTCELGLNPEKFDEMRTLVERLRDA